MSLPFPADEGRRRGAPLVMLAMLLSFWLGARVLMWEAPLAKETGQVGMAVPALSVDASPGQPADPGRDEAAAPRASGVAATSHPSTTASAAAEAATDPVTSVPAPGAPAQPLIWQKSAAPPLDANSQAAAGHQMLWLAAMAHQPEADPAERERGREAPIGDTTSPRDNP